MPQELHTFVAGRVLEHGETYNVTCNCGGNAPICPESTAGYGFAKRDSVMKVVDKITTECETCKAHITVNVLEGDPGYLLVGGEGAEQLFCPQGSSATPLEELTPEDHLAIINRMKS